MQRSCKLIRFFCKKALAALCVAIVLAFLSAAVYPAFAADTAGTDGSMHEDEEEGYLELYNPDMSDTNTCRIIVKASFPDNFQTLCAENAYVLFSNNEITVTGTVSYEKGYERTVYVPEGEYNTGAAGIYTDDSGEYKVQASPGSFTAKEDAPVTITLSLENEDDVKKKITDEYDYKEKQDNDLYESQKEENEEYQKVQEAGGTDGTNVVEEGSGISTSEWSSVQKSQEAATFRPAETANTSTTEETGENSPDALAQILNIIAAVAGITAIVIAVIVIIKARKEKN